jgi:hypothetical protein
VNIGMRADMPAAPAEAPVARRARTYEWWLVVLFLLTLPLCNPWVRGDGVGYYAFARSMLIEHRLDFTKDWLWANTSFRMGRIDAEGRLLPSQFTITGHVDNHFAVGPSILWSPFLILAHGFVLVCDRLGGRIPADGYSKPYLLAMALGTACYGFLAVFISYRVARRYVAEGRAFLAALGIWFGSSLPVYMYFNPSWSHAHSAFTVALFLWYWIRTRGRRTLKAWAVQGAIGGLMLDVYYLTAVLLLFPIAESIGEYVKARPEVEDGTAYRLLLGNVLFVITLLAAFLPTVITKEIIYGSPLTTGYEHLWVWNAPALFKVCFSADHGVFSWNPVLLLALIGLFYLCRYDRGLGVYSILVFAMLVYLVGCYTNWDGISSFGNRFFVSLTTVFVLGLAAFIDSLVRTWPERRREILTWGGTAVLVLWNLGLVFQWGMHLIPERGPVGWRVAAENQVVVVPIRAAQTVRRYFVSRKELMDSIERVDVRQIRSQKSDGED